MIISSINFNGTDNNKTNNIYRGGFLTGSICGLGYSGYDFFKKRNAIKIDYENSLKEMTKKNAKFALISSLAAITAINILGFGAVGYFCDAVMNHFHDRLTSKN